MNKDIHEIQGEILKALLLKETARFSEINAKKLSSDQLTFHLKQLLRDGVIEKIDDGSYRLTARGKEYANRFDIDSGPVKIEKQAKLSVLIIATRGSDASREYMMQTRLKQPFFGFRGFMTGKIKAGESVFETAQRELLEETGLRATIEHKAIYHERIFSQDSELLEDKYFYVFLARDAEGELVENFEGGRNEWVASQDVLAGNIFYDIADLQKLGNGDQFVFAEKSYVVEKY